MTRKFAKPVLLLACSALLAACGAAPASNELRFDNDGSGRFSGSAGAGFSEREIMSYASTDICGSGAVADFNVSVLPSAPETKIFSGTCASGGNGVAVPAAAPVYNSAAPAASAPAEVTTAGNSAGWDGSTPFVD